MKKSTLFVMLATALMSPSAFAQPDTKSPAPKPSAPAQPDKTQPKTVIPTSLPEAARPARTYSLEGVYVEACTCRGTCQAEVSGEATGCDALGAFEITKGAADGHDISATRVAFAVDHVDHLHLYLDAPDAAKRAALESFVRTALAGYGTVESVAPARIELTGKDGAYSVKVDAGKLLSLTTEPVLGGDHKTPVALNNSMHPLNPTLYQSKCMAGAYTDGDHKITIEKGRNSFFNQHMKAAKAD